MLGTISMPLYARASRQVRGVELLVLLDHLAPVGALSDGVDGGASLGLLGATGGDQRLLGQIIERLAIVSAGQDLLDQLGAVSESQRHHALAPVVERIPVLGDLRHASHALATLAVQPVAVNGVVVLQFHCASRGDPSRNPSRPALQGQPVL
jgi:hypothetical protein